MKAGFEDDQVTVVPLRPAAGKLKLDVTRSKPDTINESLALSTNV